MRIEQPGSLPPDASNLEDLLFRLLSVARDDPRLRMVSVERASTGPYDLMIQEQGSQRLGIGIVMTPNARASTAALRKLALDPEPPEHVVLVTDEERLPLRQTDRAKEYLEDLAARPNCFSWLKLGLDTHAYIDALVSALLQGEAGDLEVDYEDEARKVTGKDVLDAYVRTGVFATEDPLRPVLRLADEPKSPPGGGGGSGALEARNENHPEPTDALLPGGRDCETLLLGLVTQRPTITVVQAADLWAEESGATTPSREARARFEQAALRLSLLGRVTLRVLSGSMVLSRWGRWPSLV